MSYLNICIISVIYLSAGAAAQQFLMKPTSTAVAIGDAAVLTCAVTENALVQWLYKEAKIYDSTTKTVTDPSQYEVTHSSDTHHDLKILNVQPENTGLYTCKLPDATEANEGPAYLIGLETPTCSDDMVLNEKDPFKLHCNITFYSDDNGEKHPNLDWYRGENPIGAFSHTYTVETEVRYSISEEAGTEDDGQEFTCRVNYPTVSGQATPHYPNDVSCTTTVTVHYGPRDIEILPKPYVVDRRVKATVGDPINCTAVGNPQPTITWLDEDEKEVSGTFELLVTKEMVGGKKYTCLALNTVNDMAMNATMEITVMAEEKTSDNADNGAEHNVHLAGSLLLSWVVFWYTW